MATKRLRGKTWYLDWVDSAGPPRKVCIEIERINLKSISGVELDANAQPTNRRWKVAPTLLKAAE